MIGRLAVTAALFAVLVGSGENVKRCSAGDGTCAATNASTAATAIAVTTAVTKTSAATNASTAATATAVTSAVTKTSAKNAPKTTTTTTMAPNAVVRYDVSGNDANGTALKEIVVSDGRVTYSLDVADRPAAGNETKVSSGPRNGTGPVKHAGGVDSPATAVTDTNGTKLVDATTTVTVITTTTTEKIKVSPKDGNAQVVRFVPHKYCYCDMINGSCDVNCCCDTDCTDDDTKTFTSCSDQATSSVIKTQSILFDSALFYVVIDNVPSDYFYPERDAVVSESRFATSTRDRDLFAWPPRAKTERAAAAGEPAGHDLKYKSLRWMYTAASEADPSGLRAFGVKSGAFDSLCTVERPVEYLVPTETRCRTYVSNLTWACAEGSPLSSDGYHGGGKGGEDVFRAVRPIDGSNKTERFGVFAVRATAAHRCARTDGSWYDCGPAAVYSRGVCRRAVVAVEYRVTHDGARGVLRVDALFRHRDVRDAGGRPVYVDQRFGVRFVRAGGGAATDDGGPRERSGRPGYAVGAPLLWTMADGRRRPEPGPRPVCGAFPPGFMHNVDVRCRVRVRRTAADAASADLCHGIRNETVAALGDYEGASVASLGDPDVARWIPVVVVGPPAVPRPPSDGWCAAVTDRVHVRVLYAHVGTFDRPQAAVLGVLVNYTASPVAVAETTRDRNYDDDDDDDNDDGGGGGVKTTVAEVPVRATVEFVDLTGPPVRTFAEPPTYEFRLPEDFYYPFWSSDGYGASSAPRLLRAAVGLSAAVPLACAARAYL